MMTSTEGVTIEILSGPDYSRDKDGWEHNGYTLKLHYQGREMEIPWRQGLGITDDPNPADVMEALALDAAGFVNARDFDDWASEYGYDSDSRTAERIYNGVDTQTQQLRTLLGNDFDSIVFPDS